MFPPSNFVPTGKPTTQVGIGNRNIFAPTSPVAGAGIIKPGTTPAPSPPSPATAYAASIPQTGADYSNIMSAFKNLASAPSPSLDFMNAYKQAIASPYQPTAQPYQKTPDESQAIATQAQYAQTGGLSATEIADMRARGISPIRAIYANAQQNLQRQRALQGGYSPGYTAATTRMARDEAQQISDAVTGVNADIAGKQQAGRLSASSGAAATAGAQAGAQRDIQARNTEAQNQAALINRQATLDYLTKGYTSMLDDYNRKMDATKGMLSLYGTTPALASTFGAQAAQQAGMQQNANQWAYGTGINKAIGAGYGG